VKENELILCVIHNGKLHQALMTDDERDLFESVVKSIVTDKTLKVSETPICDIEIYRGGKKVTADA
jgi:hypothetical protein